MKKKAKQLYDKGIELKNAKKYKEAIEWSFHIS